MPQVATAAARSPLSPCGGKRQLTEGAIVARYSAKARRPVPPPRSTVTHRGSAMAAACSPAPTAGAALAVEVFTLAPPPRGAPAAGILCFAMLPSREAAPNAQRPTPYALRSEE